MNVLQVTVLRNKNPKHKIAKILILCKRRRGRIQADREHLRRSRWQSEVALSGLKMEDMNRNMASASKVLNVPIKQLKSLAISC